MYNTNRVTISISLVLVLALTDTHTDSDLLNVNQQCYWQSVTLTAESVL